jgi:hypothetical protein
MTFKYLSVQDINEFIAKKITTILQAIKFVMICAGGVCPIAGIMAGSRIG